MEKINNLTKSTVFKQFLGFGIGPIVGMFISFLTVPITTRMVSPEEFGKSALFTLLQSVFLIVSLLGLDQSYIRFYNSKEHSKEAVLFNSFVLPFLLSLFLGVISLFLMRPLSQWLFGSFEPLLMVLFFPFLITLIFNRYAFLILRMSLQGKLYSAVNLITQIITFIILVLLLLFYEKTFRSIVLATMLSTFLATIVVVTTTINEWKFPKSLFSKPLFKELLQFALPLVPTTIIYWLFTSFDKVALKEWSSLEELGLYAAAFKIGAVLTIFQTILSTGLAPITFKWYENNEPKKKFILVYDLVVSSMTLLFAGIVFLRGVLLFMLGPSYKNTEPVFIYLLIVPYLTCISYSSNFGIDLKKKTYFWTITTTVGAVLNLLLNFLLVPKLGAKGAAIATAISFFVYFILSFLISRKLWIKLPLLHLTLNFLFIMLLILNFEFQFYKLFELALIILVVLYNSVYMNKSLKKNK